MITSADKSPLRKVTKIPFGIPRLDAMIGGGFPIGYTTELIGEAGTGKSTLAMFAVREAQRLGLKCYYADAEKTFAFDFAEKIGIDLKKLDMAYYDTAEEYLTEIVDFDKKKKYDLFIIDSIGALEAQEDAEKELAAKGYPALTLLLARFLRKILPGMNAALLLINHEKDSFTGGKRILGGKSLKFHKSLSLKLYHNGTNVVSGDEILGKVVMVKVEKIKAFLNGTPWEEVKLRYMKESGFTGNEDLIEEAVLKGVITKIANTHFFGEEKLGTMSKLREWIKIPENETLIKEALK